MSDIILVTHWTGGDVYPFIRYGRLLHSEGHNVTIFTHCKYEQDALNSGLRFVAVDTPEEYEQISHDLYNLSDPFGNRDDYLNFHKTYHGKERLLREVGLIEKECSSDTIIISRFRSSVSGQLVAEKNHLRYASLNLAPNFFSHMELHDQLFGSDFLEDINAARAALDLPKVNNWKDWLYSPKTILCGWPEWYAASDETWPEGAYMLGFFEDKKQREDNPPCLLPDTQALIDNAKAEGKKCIIITGGSSRLINKEFYDTAVDAVAMTGDAGFIVSPFEDLLPSPLPENIFWTPNAPMRAMMKVSDLIIHHGGIGTINEAVDNALPQVVLPHMADRPDNADRLFNMGIALKFPPKYWNPQLICDEIKGFLTDDTIALCEEYQLKNEAEYKAKKWLSIIDQLSIYELPEHDDKRNDQLDDDSKSDISRKRMLELLKRKRMLSASDK